MLYRISVTERGLTGIANIFRSRLSKLDDLLGAGTVPLSEHPGHRLCIPMRHGGLTVLRYVEFQSPFFRQGHDVHSAARRHWIPAVRTHRQTLSDLRGTRPLHRVFRLPLRHREGTARRENGTSALVIVLLRYHSCAIN